MRTLRAGNSSRAVGFTLLELVVVMLILVAMLGLVLPQASSVFVRNDLKTSSRRLAGAVAYARSQAMLERVEQQLTLDLDAKKAQNEQLNSGQVALRFQPKGLVEPAVIHLAGSGERVQTISIKAFNGRCVIQDGYVELE